MKSQRNRQAFALITTLAAMTVSLLLLAAFLQANQSLFSLGRNDADRQACRDVLDSLTAFCHYQLEKKTEWGDDDWKDAQVVTFDSSNPIFELTKVPPSSKAVKDGHDLIGYRHLLGQDPETGVDIHIAFSNNLNNSVAREFVGHGTRENVPANICYVRLSASRGAHREQIELTLRKSAFFDSTLASSNGINIELTGNDRDLEGDSKLVVFHSKDPIYNQIRSEADIKLPASDRLSFRPDSGQGIAPTQPVNGTIWSKGSVSINGSSTASRLNSTAQNHNIEIIDHAKNHYEIPELTAENIKGHDRTDKVELAPRRYLFSERLIHTDDPSAGISALPVRVLEELNPETNEIIKFHFNEEDFNISDGELRLPDGTVVPGEAHSSDKFTLDGGIQVLMRGKDYNKNTDNKQSTNPMVILPEAATVDGQFEIAARNYIPHMVPSIVFGSDGRDGYLAAKSNLRLEGYLKGGGKLISEHGNVALLPNRVEVETDEQYDFSVFAGNNVIINPPVNLEARLESDTDVYYDPVTGNWVSADDQTSDSTDTTELSDLTFRGLVYAKNNFIFSSVRRDQDGNVVRASAGAVKFRRRLVVEGAIVAQNGTIDIESRRGVHLTYNPKYLDDFLEKNFLDSRAKITVVSHRPIPR